MPVLMTTPAGGDLGTFTTFATTFLSWLTDTFGTLLSWMVEHPIVFVGLIMGLIVTAIGTLRHLIGG